MGKRGPMPKPADRIHGHRKRAVTKAVVDVSPVSALPPPRADWLDATRASWGTYWASDVSVAVIDVDLPAVTRLFDLYDQHARSMDVVRMALVVKGSTGQIRTNPLADHVLKLEGVILRLENELGLTPLARSRLGLTIARPATARDGESVPHRYDHLRVVNE